ncbi:hypothetical protein [Streptomyces aureus]|uniref:hypothetical protein n=1 Tax=Streptomyces aureus TaxID=193461 RepID=UPI0036430336
MTHTLVSTPRTAPGSTPRTDRLRRVLRAVAVVSCLPYLAVKAAWIAGSHLGIPDGSPLLDHRASMIVANSLSALLDSAVIVLALLLTRPWGRRAPAWLLVFPMWVATGLLAPIMTGYPLQLLVRAFGGSVNHGGSKGEPFLDEWVFGVVYTGFILQGLTLGALFALYARDRWGHTWHGPVRELPRPRPTPAGGPWRSPPRCSPCFPWPCTRCGRAARPRDSTPPGSRTVQVTSTSWRRRTWPSWPPPRSARCPSPSGAAAVCR